MKHIICSIYDKATQAYMRPFTAQSPGQATRMFIDEALREDSEIGKHPEDYALFIIADFEDNNGAMLQSKDQPQKLATGRDAALYDSKKHMTHTLGVELEPELGNKVPIPTATDRGGIRT